MKMARAVSGILIVAGLWEALAPFILGYPNTATALWNDLLIGVILFTLGLSALILDDIDAYRTLDWISATLGLWLVLASFIPSYSASRVAVWNDMTVGLLVIELAGWTAIGLGRPTTGHS